MVERVQVEPPAGLNHESYCHHRFLKGHRIMVQLQSTWFPLIDRNPQTFVPNIFEAKETDYRPATHTIHRSTRDPSLPVAPAR